MPIRVIGYFPTVRVTNDETVKIRKVGYQGPAGRPASDFNFSELANVADGAAPTLGRIPWGDGTLWQSVALTAALAGADPAGSAATAQAAAQAFATAADVTVLSTANSTAQGYANTAQTNAATRSDNASNLSTGTVPLARLANITTAQLSATAGILSDQIAGLDAAKLTGQVAASLINGGTSSQFLRGDGTFSNTLEGGLTLGNSLVFGLGSVTPVETDRWIYPHNSGFIFNVPSGLGYHFRCNGSGVHSITQAGAIWGGTHDWNTGAAQVRISSTGIWLSSGLGTATIVMGSGNISMGSGSINLGNSASVSPSVNGLSGTVSGPVINANSGLNIRAQIAGTAITTTSATGLAVTGAMSASSTIYGSAGTTNAANNEIVGAVGGNRYNVASGLAHTLLVAGTEALTVSATEANLSGGLNVAGLLRITSSAGLIYGASGGAGYLTIAGSNAGGYCTYFGSGHASQAGNVIAGTGNVSGALFSFNCWTGSALSAAFTIANSALTCGRGLVLASGAPATATSAGTAGQIAWDASGNIYIGSATNTWRRVATATF